MACAGTAPAPAAFWPAAAGPLAVAGGGAWGTRAPGTPIALRAFFLARFLADLVSGNAGTKAVA